MYMENPVESRHNMGFQLVEWLLPWYTRRLDNFLVIRRYLTQLPTNLSNQRNACLDGGNLDSI